MPPDASIRCPFIQRALSEHKNAIMPPISLALPVTKAIFGIILMMMMR